MENSREAFNKFAFDPNDELYPLKDPHTAGRIDGNQPRTCASCCPCARGAVAL